MNEKQLKETLTPLMADIFQIEDLLIQESSDIDNIENWDSLNQYNLIMALEESFSVEFDAEEILELTSYQSIYDCLKKKIN